MSLKRFLPNFLRGHNGAVLSIGFGLSLLVTLFWLAGFFDVLELSSQNSRFELRGPINPTAPAVIVAIDDESLNGWMDTNGHTQTMPDRWTWPRSVYATLVDNLKAAGAKVIAFDMVFSESSKIHPEQDWAFGDACKRAGNVVLGFRYDSTAKKFGVERHKETLIPALAQAAVDQGVVTADPGKDNFLRRFPLKDFVENEPNLDLAVLRQYLWGKKVAFQCDEQKNILTIGNRAIPLQDGIFLPVNFVGGPGTFPTFSFHQVYYKTMDMNVFKDKVVYVGSTTEILHDNHFSPFSVKHNDMPGVEIHANALDTMLSQDFLKFPSLSAEAFIIFLLGVVTSLLTFKVKAWQGMLVMLLEILIYVVAANYSFLQTRWMLPMVAPTVSIFISFAGLTAYRVIVEEKKARDIRNQFSRYVSKSIVDEILKDPSKISLGGETKEVTILFSDVRGFTAMSEKLSAPQVVEILNEYLTAMVDIVIENNGTLDKYVGDAIMAVWGSPLADPDHRHKAVKTAVEMMEKLSELKKKWVSEGKPEIDIGLGLNSGHVVAGNMGHLHYKMDYTVIGDDVNLAARLESANKEMRSHILISQSTYDGCRELVEVIEHPPIKVKGKEKTIPIYEVIGWKGQGRAAWAVPLAAH